MLYLARVELHGRGCTWPVSQRFVQRSNEDHDGDHLRRTEVIDVYCNEALVLNDLSCGLSCGLSFVQNCDQNWICGFLYGR